MSEYDDVLPPPYRRPSHKPVKKRRKGHGEEEDRSQNHLSRRGQIQRCSNCGAAGHKKIGCPRPPSDAQTSTQARSQSTLTGRKKLPIRSMAKSATQPADQAVMVF
ncbi:hypothetical protein PIB30_065642 [Stylosanthes scabra]|uniref:CCHC-type domain-containing protein n=1 Tax=Stylosanthes scabra TaxID=79078 RepID=A0ABU6QLV3_9FABA|nr:hypothetical protein [Stylosanthes scabra]